MRTLHQAPLLSRRQEARGDTSQIGTMNTPCRRQPAAGGRGRHRIGGTPGGVAGPGKEDSFQHATNESSLDIPSMSREYKSWPALGDMDDAVHTILVVGYGLCHFVQSTAPPHGLRVQKAGLPARSGRGAKKRRPPHRCYQDAGVFGVRSQYGVVAQMCRAPPGRVATKTHLGSKSKYK